jgi:hypothetical protein
MSVINPIIDGIAAIKEIIASLTSVSPEIEEAKVAMRADLNKLGKKELIELLINERIKCSKPEPSQKDLLLAVLKEDRCMALNYDDISETILANMDTKLKYAPHNISWWKSQFTTSGEKLAARMTAADRNRLDRQMAKDAIKNM